MPSSRLLPPTAYSRLSITATPKSMTIKVIKVIIKVINKSKTMMIINTL